MVVVGAGVVVVGCSVVVVTVVGARVDVLVVGVTRGIKLWLARRTHSAFFL